MTAAAAAQLNNSMINGRPITVDFAINLQDAVAAKQEAYEMGGLSMEEE